MNTYLIPWYDESECNILKITANSIDECEEKVMEHCADKFDDDDLAGFDDYEEFLDDIWERFNLYLGDIHEIEEYESQNSVRHR